MGWEVSLAPGAPRTIEPGGEARAHAASARARALAPHASAEAGVSHLGSGVVLVGAIGKEDGKQRASKRRKLRAERRLLAEAAGDVAYYTTLARVTPHSVKVDESTSDYRRLAVPHCPETRPFL